MDVMHALVRAAAGSALESGLWFALVFAAMRAQLGAPGWRAAVPVFFQVWAVQMVARVALGEGSLTDPLELALFVVLPACTSAVLLRRTFQVR